MKAYLIIALFVLATFSPVPLFAGSSVRSYFPHENIPEFLVKHLDLASFRSSMGPRREAGKNTFYKLGIRQWKFSQNKAVHDTGGWYYKIRVLKVKDVNDDGIEDIEVCFSDRATNGGTYNTQKPVLITKYSKSTPPIAIKYEVFGCDAFK